jgi:hypothetical protein
VSEEPVHRSVALEQVLREVHDHVDGLFDLLDRVRAPLEQRLDASDIRPERVGLVGLTELLRSVGGPLCTTALGTERPVAGMGFVARGGNGDGYSMLWWVVRNGVVIEKRHNLNPTSDAFYDFRDAGWFSVPMGTGGPALEGPYIDAWGTDDLTITAALPLRAGDRSLGVIALDVAVSGFVSELTDALDRLDLPAVLTNADGRVVASTVPELSTGLRLTPRSGTTGSAPAALERHDLGRYGWSLVLLQGARPPS